jgi:hypothetical protein
VSQRKVYEWAERIKEEWANIDDARSWRPLSLKRVEVKQQIQDNQRIGPNETASEISINHETVCCNNGL